MSKGKRVAATLVGLTAAVAVAVPVASSAGPGQVVNVKTTVTLGQAGYQGKVKSANANCVGERTVVLKQKGNGVISRSVSKPNGNWIANTDELNAKIKIPAKVFAEVKPSTQATAGPIYKCGEAVSQIREIAGG